MQLVKIEVPPNAKPTYLQHLSDAESATVVSSVQNLYIVVPL
jgi:hypothetical protein